MSEPINVPAVVTPEAPQQVQRKMPEWKRQWQQRQRDQFKAKHGYSQTSHYRFKGQRQSALERDGFACVVCHMTDAEHKAKWGRPITVDHKDKDETHNELANLQTLCLTCHGKKDITPALTQPKHKISVQAMANLRAFGKTFREIGQAAGIDGSRCRKLMLKYQPESL